MVTCRSDSPWASSPCSLPPLFLHWIVPYFLKPQGVASARKSFASSNLQWNSGLTPISCLISVFIFMVAFTLLYFIAFSFSLFR